MSRSASLGLCAAATLAACNSATTFGSGSLSGSAAFPVNLSVAAPLNPVLPDGGPDLSVIEVELADITGQLPTTCGADGGATLLKAVLIELASGSASPAAPGTFPASSVIGLGGAASAVVETIDDQGNVVALSQSGAVVLSAAGATFAGTFSVGLVDNLGRNTAPLSGSFEAPLCGG